MTWQPTARVTMSCRAAYRLIGSADCGNFGRVMAKSQLTDRRLLGTWRSDGRRTGAEIAARRDIKNSNKKRLRSLFGKLVLRYTKTRCYATLNGETRISRYMVAA